jgi:hypothetical protein
VFGVRGCMLGPIITYCCCTSKPSLCDLRRHSQCASIVFTRYNTWHVTRHTHTSQVTSHTTYDTRHTTHVTCQTSRVTRHTSHITRRNTLLVERDTLHVARRTSQITRHTSQVKRHMSAIRYTHQCSRVTAAQQRQNNLKTQMVRMRLLWINGGTPDTVCCLRGKTGFAHVAPAASSAAMQAWCPSLLAISKGDPPSLQKNLRQTLQGQQAAKQAHHQLKQHGPTQPLKCAQQCCKASSAHSMHAQAPQQQRSLVHSIHVGTTLDKELDSGSVACCSCHVNGSQSLPEAPGVRQRPSCSPLPINHARTPPSRPSFQQHNICTHAFCTCAHMLSNQPRPLNMNVALTRHIA